MNKVPCGGFELGESLIMKDGKLDLAEGAGGGLPTGGAPYQQLVTDGTGTAKWEDRLAYDTVMETELMPEQTVAFSDSGSGFYVGTSPITISLIEGYDYKLKFDGEQYDCGRYVMDADGYKYLGNMSIVGGSNTGEPFLFVSSGEQCGWYCLDSATQHTISVSQVSIETKKIAEKYVEPEVFWITKDDEKDTIDKTLDEVNDAYDAGKILIVKSGQNVWFCVGRVRKTDGPIFLCYSYTRNQFGVYVNTPFSEYPSSGLVELQHKITDSVILNSSTKDSTKKFKITVDDSGTISATEV